MDEPITNTQLEQSLAQTVDKLEAKLADAERELALRCKCEFRDVDVPVNECRYHLGTADAEEDRDAERRAEEAEQTMDATHCGARVGEKCQNTSECLVCELRRAHEGEMQRAEKAERRAEKAERKVDARDTGWAGTRIAELKDELADTVQRAEKAEAAWNKQADQYTKLEAKNTELRPALENLAADVRRWNLCDAMPDMGGKHKGWLYPQLEVYVKRALASDGSAVDPSKPELGCGVCPACAASDNDPERCTGGLPAGEMSETWRVEIEEELDCETLAVYVGTKELGRYIITDDPQAERQDFTDMITACVASGRSAVGDVIGLSAPLSAAVGDVLRAAETTAAQWETSQLLIAPLCHKLTEQLKAVRAWRKERGE